MSEWCNAAWVAVWRRSENLSRTSGGCLAWIIRVRRRKSGNARDPCHGPWALVEPRDNAVDIDRGSGRDVLQVRFRETPILRVAEPKSAYPLGERAFDPCTAPVLPLALFTRIPVLPPAKKETKITGLKMGPGVMWAHWCLVVAGKTTTKGGWGP